MPTIKIHYFSDDLPRLQKTEKGDWIDLYCAQTMQLHELWDKTNSTITDGTIAAEVPAHGVKVFRLIG